MKQNSLVRIVKAVIHNYPIHCLLVLIFIIISSLASVYGSMFLQQLVDGYITPLIGQANPNYMPLFHALIQVSIIFLIGVLANWLFNFLCVTISVGSLKKLRDGLFKHMETLPIGYFDTHAHGDIMSVYTNDIDTLRQLLSQSIPMALSSLITLITVSISMLILNIPLACVTFAVGALMIIVSKMCQKNPVLILFANKKILEQSMALLKR